MDYKEQVEQVVSSAKFGDLIEFSYPIGYSHWGVYDGDGYVIHFAVAELAFSIPDESQVMSSFRGFLQTVFPVCGDLLLGETKIRRQLLSEVNVPKGARVLVSNTRHNLQPSPVDEIRRRRDALLDKEFTYKVLTFNCEHFATFVRSGKAMCNQIPGKSKNKECEDATEQFSSLVPSNTELLMPIYTLSQEYCVEFH
ncbi:phospholipase A and acyltransferase 4-like isoform X3 [Siphateles boraxobius]|uniref:phospholipase A and acyltransferase 4-like isoform X3 n=1 Tax=Siphateles boraxobius TaxID=180520 RepID=UPI004063A2AC